jgi:hypothetical protein
MQILKHGLQTQTTANYMRTTRSNTVVLQKLIVTQVINIFLVLWNLKVNNRPHKRYQLDPIRRIHSNFIHHVSRSIIILSPHLRAYLASSDFWAIFISPACNTSRQFHPPWLNHPILYEKFNYGAPNYVLLSVIPVLISLILKNLNRFLIWKKDRTLLIGKSTEHSYSVFFFLGFNVFLSVCIKATLKFRNGKKRKPRFCILKHQKSWR